MPTTAELPLANINTTYGFQFGARSLRMETRTPPSTVQKFEMQLLQDINTSRRKNFNEHRPFLNKMSPILPNAEDSLECRIPSNCPAEIKAILSAAWLHNLDTLKPLLNEPGKASVQEPTTKETPLHAAIRSCGPAEIIDDTTRREKAKDVVAELFQWGGIWNDVDNKNETPGCVALRLGQKDLYELCVAAGMRAEILFGILDYGYEELGSEDDNETDDQIDEEQQKENGEANGDTTITDIAIEFEDEKGFEKALAAVAANTNAAAAGVNNAAPLIANDHTVTNEAYLASDLALDPKKLVDEAGNGIMMAWETEIMRQSVISLLSMPDFAAPQLVGSSATSPQLPPSQPTGIEIDTSELLQGKRILNIGFGMGIIDTFFASTAPSKHHIIEAHPAVVDYIRMSPNSKFGCKWASEQPEGANKVWKGRWQDICPRLLADGEVYDAIYFDTFGEDYSQLRMFFTEYIPGLLDQNGRFGFFNGLGADRQICYDVYQKVVEMHLSDAGLDVEWNEVSVDMKNMGEEGKGEWEGIVRRYWTLESKYPLNCVKFPLAFINDSVIQFLIVMTCVFGWYFNIQENRANSYHRIPIACVYIYGLMRYMNSTQYLPTI